MCGNGRRRSSAAQGRKSRFTLHRGVRHVARHDRAGGRPRTGPVRIRLRRNGRRDGDAGRWRRQRHGIGGDGCGARQSVARGIRPAGEVGVHGRTRTGQRHPPASCPRPARHRPAEVVRAARRNHAQVRGRAGGVGQAARRADAVLRGRQGRRTLFRARRAAARGRQQWPGLERDDPWREHRRNRVVDRRGAHRNRGGRARQRSGAHFPPGIR